ncbi:MAG: thiol:disulfide interchange protein DsbA/DsbL [Gammaproteobacteria bacterium]|nr:thiol:disulfide interchange protein DsbA/DsbL [Gammaproteobacteria bacterium]
MSRYVLTAVLLLGLLPAVAAQSRLETFRQNEHYIVLPVPTATGTTGQSHGGLLVQELFSYACIHCHRLEPALATWTGQLPDDVRFERVPAVFSRSWMLLAEAYYVAEVCGVLGVTHDAMFAAIHEDGRQFKDAADIALFYADRVRAVGQRRGQRCRSREDFLAAFESLEVAQAVAQALALSRVWQVGSVPTLVVAGQWRSDGRLAGSNEAMLDVADYLLRRTRAEAQTSDGSADY